MIETIIAALLPIVVTLMLGFFAGWRHDFTQSQAGILNRMVMSYALPMTLFAGIMTTSFHNIADHLPVLAWIALGMIGGFAVVIVVNRFILHADWGLTALRGLAIAGPAVPFVGIPVLGDLYPTESTLAVTISSLVMNIIQVPIVLVLLSLDGQQAATVAATASAGVPASVSAGVPAGASAAIPAGGAAPASPAPSSAASPTPAPGLGSILLSTFKKSVVWMPLLAFVLILFGVDLPKKWEGSFTLLGSATGGVALFAVGATLFAQRITLSWVTVVNVIAKNLILPGVVLLGMVAAGVSTSGSDIGLATVSLAIPTASICVIFAVQYKKAEREMSATLLISTLFSVVTMALFIWLTHAL